MTKLTSDGQCAKASGNNDDEPRVFILPPMPTDKTCRLLIERIEGKND